MSGLIHDFDEYPEAKRKQKEVIYNENWDVLVILDACRWDALDAVWEYKVEPIESAAPGRGTPAWLQETWLNGHPINDLTYISGHPWTAGHEFGGDQLDPMGQHVAEHVPAYDETWDEILGTSRPDVLSQIVKEHEPPIVIHYLQPHTPHIGKLGVKAEQSIAGFSNSDHSPFERRQSESDHPIIPSYSEYNETGHALYRMVLDGTIPKELVREAYLDNVRLVMRFVRDLVLTFDKVAITSDHGEMLGENDHYGHRGQSYPQNEISPWWMSV